MARKICVVTGSRAEYGLLYWVLHDLQGNPDFELQIVVTGMHLAPEFGHTVDEIVKDGFAISRRVEMLLSSDTRGGIAKSVGLGVIGMSDAIEALCPDVALVLGDRFEIFAAVQACLIHNVPVVHLAGGDVSEGAIDESIRHAITKMSQVHFVTNELSARRVRQLGEDPRRIHVVGNPGLDHLRRTALLDRDALEAALGARLAQRNLLVTFHPVTLEASAGVDQFTELLAALESLGPETMLWITRPNADAGGRAITAALEAWAASRPAQVHTYTSLGQLRYLSLMAQVDAVVGNSSSGLYEAPSFGVPTVNIGDRQRGRLAAPSVLHCAPDRRAIATTIGRALSLDCSGIINPYGDGNSAARIVKLLGELPPADELIKKPFHLVGTVHV
jgi:UDP-N-acetylglucosamine 2-epimerase (non-hydrolysing)/GDP/UDP-N,N'-diacetylbacillosamine 2-epimerase (hydrolysing)